jgi:hypothetical protein
MPSARCACDDFYVFIGISICITLFPRAPQFYFRFVFLRWVQKIYRTESKSTDDSDEAIDNHHFHLLDEEYEQHLLKLVIILVVLIVLPNVCCVRLGKEKND